MVGPHRRSPWAESYTRVPDQDVSHVLCRVNSQAFTCRRNSVRLTPSTRRLQTDMKVWIDQDLCTGDGLCEEIAPTCSPCSTTASPTFEEGGKIYRRGEGQPAGSRGHRQDPRRPARRRDRIRRGMPRRVHLHRALTSHVPLGPVRGSSRGSGISTAPIHVCVRISEGRSSVFPTQTPIEWRRSWAREAGCSCRPGVGSAA